VASSGFARVAAEAEQGIYYKEFLPRSPLESLKGLMRGSRATRAREQSDALLEAGFNAPENLIWGKLNGGREYLFSRSVPGEGVTWWLRTELTGRQVQDLAVRRQLLRQLGDYIGRLHGAGFIHGDLRPSNVLAHRQQQRFEFSLIDNERNKRSLPTSGKGMLKNLMQLNMLLPSDLTRSDRWRFFMAWRAQMTTLSDAEARLLARESFEWAMRRLRAKGKV
jgi:Lipopolysaccharide kinase (Kdo/WaaP) family